MDALVSLWEMMESILTRLCLRLKLLPRCAFLFVGCRKHARTEVFFFLAGEHVEVFVDLDQVSLSGWVGGAIEKMEYLVEG